MAMHWSNPSCVSVNITLRPPQLAVASWADKFGGVDSKSVIEVVASLLVDGKEDFPP